MYKISVLLSLVVASFGATFSSTYIDIVEDKWAWEEGNTEFGGDGSKTFELFGGYYLFEYYSAGASLREVNSHKNTNYRLPLYTLENGLSPTGYGQKLEVRYYGATPFAVIYRVSYSLYDDTLIPQGEFLIVRGLKGFENIKADIDVKKAKDANSRARAIADSLYLKSGVIKSR